MRRFHISLHRIRPIRAWLAAGPGGPKGGQKEMGGIFCHPFLFRRVIELRDSAPAPILRTRASTFPWRAPSAICAVPAVRSLPPQVRSASRKALLRRYPKRCARRRRWSSTAAEPSCHRTKQPAVLKVEPLARAARWPTLRLTARWTIACRELRAMRQAAKLPEKRIFPPAWMPKGKQATAPRARARFPQQARAVPQARWRHSLWHRLAQHRRRF